MKKRTNMYQDKIGKDVPRRTNKILENTYQDVTRTKLERTYQHVQKTKLETTYQYVPTTSWKQRTKTYQNKLDEIIDDDWWWLMVINDG